MATLPSQAIPATRDPLRGLRLRANLALVVACAGLAFWIAAAIQLG